MKKQEEIEQLANNYWEGCDGCDANDKYFFIKGFGCAYRQLKEDMADKKYTEEDLLHAFREGVLLPNSQIGIMEDIFKQVVHSLNKQD